jgi:ATP-dependent Lon protease
MFMRNAEGRVPVLPTKNLVLFPGTTVPLNVGRPRSVAAVDAARRGEGFLVVVAQKVDRPEGEPEISELYRVATLSKIERVRGDAEHGFQVLVRGVRRVRVLDYQERAAEDGDGAVLVDAEVMDFPDVKDADERTLDALVANVKELAKEILELIPGDTRQASELVTSIDDAELLTHLCAEYLDVPLATKQELLEVNSLKGRALKLLDLMQTQKNTLKVQGEIREKLSRRMGKLQREAILREQMKTIREELGDGDADAADDDYQKKIEDAGMPEEAKKVALDEAKRLAAIGNTSPEAHVIRNYLDLLVAMPWSKLSEDDLDLVKARAILDADHYGLAPVKKRIVQHLAVLKLRAAAAALEAETRSEAATAAEEGKEGKAEGGGEVVSKEAPKGSILLFIGPPGVGKTSLGQSIAKALGRKFVRVSLGGVRDDAEIRGHRRTYIGAMPGRIVQGIKRAGVKNPVLMLDEIDKLGRGYSGDPAAALLEVLDPEQNVNFHDHYLDVPFDLSKAFFIATANSLESIPGPLLDRMEVIDLTGYITAEKLHIAKNHLLPKALYEHGIKPSQVKIGDEALIRIITHYTREAGVRELARKLSELLRALTEKVLAGGVGGTVNVAVSDLEELLGAEKFVHEVAERAVPPGVVTGLAWTPVGGEILFIEASLMPGTGKLTLTGQLGEVMKESAQIALSLVRSHLPPHVPGFDVDKKDLHVHVPAGAIPKDGPSAGVAMVATLASLFTGRRVPPTLAMTGEVTLRGAVMPVGGIKEKVIAAHRAGIKTVILPKRNEKDLKDVPDEVKQHLRFEFAETVVDVLKLTIDLDVSEVDAERVPFGGTPASTPAVPQASGHH